MPPGPLAASVPQPWLARGSVTIYIYAEGKSSALPGGMLLSKRVWVRISRNNTELTLRDLHEKIAEIQRQNPDLDVFFDGDEYAICSRPKPRTEVGEDEAEGLVDQVK